MNEWMIVLTVCLQHASEQLLSKLVYKLSSWWSQPLWKIFVKMGTFPIIENNKYLKPPPMSSSHTCWGYLRVWSVCFWRCGPVISNLTRWRTGCSMRRHDLQQKNLGSFNQHQKEMPKTGSHGEANTTANQPKVTGMCMEVIVTS